MFFERRWAGLLEMISSPILRRQVVAVWKRAAQAGDWSEAELDRVPFTVLIDARGIGLLDHSRVAAQGALALYDAMRQNYATLPFTVNPDLLILGGLLHDVGKLLEYRPCENGFRSGPHGRWHAFDSSLLVAQEGLPEAIVRLIAAIQDPALPQNTESILVRQADMATFRTMALLAEHKLIL